MSFAAGSYGLAAAAGVLSMLSPCVLPLVPIVVGSAAAAHRLGPLALAAGMALSFTVLGLFVATIGFAIGLDEDLFRTLGAVVLALFGLLLLSSGAQARFAGLTGPIGRGADQLIARLAPEGLGGQLVMGLLLGAVWSPCVGPTLGAAATLAAQSEALPEVALIMVIFGLGAAAPLLLVGTLSREALLRWRGRLGATGHWGKTVLGLLMLAIGAAILTGFDKHVEATLVAWSPTWLIELTTRF